MSQFGTFAGDRSRNVVVVVVCCILSSKVSSVARPKLRSLETPSEIFSAADARVVIAVGTAQQCIYRDG